MLWFIDTFTLINYRSETELILTGNNMAMVVLNFISTHKHASSKNITYWYRFVDDILVFFTGISRHLNTLENFIIPVQPNHSFITGIEQHNSKNFSVITITKLNNIHVFAIYRKPAFTNTTIYQCQHNSMT